MIELVHITEMLEQAASGGGLAADRLLPMVYDQLRAMAQRKSDSLWHFGSRINA